MNENLLSVKNLTTEFTSGAKIIPAVNSISFQLGKGETLGIVGESGSGKSVTALSIMRLIPSPPGKIRNGEIFFHSQKRSGHADLLKIPGKELETIRGNEISMIFQEPMTSLNPVFTCGKQIDEAILLHKKVSKKEAHRQTLELFKKVQLTKPELIYNAYPHQISGGQKQRVMIAMAICCDPSLLIADEPTTSLDVTVQKAILQLLKNLQRESRMSLIFISHDLGVIAEIADHVLVMYRGAIVEQGNVKDIFSHPQHPYTRGLLACRPPLNVKMKRLPVIADFIKEADPLQNIPIFHNSPGPENIITKEEKESRAKLLYQNNPVLKVEQLKKYFPVKKSLFGKIQDYVHAVDDVSFEVYPGETLGLVGESGCGKTTLGKTIMQLLLPDSGNIIFKNKNLSALSSEELREIRKSIQIIFQDPYSSLNPRITIGEAITEPMRIHEMYESEQVRKQKALELLHRVNMNESHFNRYPHEFSGGQRQRICIARALALNPEFIICDECVSSLDISIQSQVLNLLNELKEKFNFTYIFISHDLSVVKFMSDRIIVMNNGRIEESGDAEEIYHHPKSAYTRQLIAAIPKGFVPAESN